MTITDEAVEAAWLAFDNACPGEHWLAHDRIRAALEAAEKHRAGGVRVKPLEWPPTMIGATRVRSIIGPDALTQYTICRADVLYRWARQGGPWSEPFFAYEHAIRDAQADFERRILSAIAAPVKGPEPDNEYVKEPDAPDDETVAAELSASDPLRSVGAAREDGRSAATAPAAMPVKPAAWRYSINYGPDGEQNYAMVYDENGMLVGNLRIHHAIAVVGAKSALAASDAARQKAEEDDKSHIAELEAINREATRQVEAAEAQLAQAADPLADPRVVEASTWDAAAEYVSMWITSGPDMGLCLKIGAALFQKAADLRSKATGA